MANWDSAFNELVAARGRALSAYAYLLCGEPAESADLVQEALLRTFTRVRVGGDIDGLEAYTRRAILTIYLDDRRRRDRWRTKRHLLVSDPDGGERDEQIVTADAVRSALATLSPKQRACVVLRFYEDLPIVAVAVELGCSEGNVKRHLADAKTRLAEELGVVEESLT